MAADGHKSAAKSTPLFGDLVSGLADGGHGGSEEGFEVVGGIGVLGDGGFDGLLGDGAGVAEVDEGGEGVVSGGAVVGASDGGGDGYGEVVELVFEFEDYALGGLLAYAGDPGEGGGVTGGDGGDEAGGGDGTPGRDGQGWAGGGGG